MKKYSYLLFLFILSAFTSCLTGGMNDLPEFEENDITGIYRVEYRYISDDVNPASGEKNVVKVELGKSNIVIDDQAGTISFDVSVPAAGGSFPAAEREKCTVNNIGVMVSISTAARLSPVGESPVLGIPGDWSKPNKYIVTAANGAQKEWTISVSKFTK
ncbi:hypothetical protein DW083_03200 [Parabacteroides sp. AF48-14]|uniref:DUF5018-related domain-containing protein n=1 Tax=Parabacteroides sp. AF48-14 TaxID=2292052 RepID=UPI000EFEE4C9|nr:hypothetical protein [Parabacteroides sp. AF48-14]RHO74400.1 hypothetical protein DW083_03200 [Parabacteroides sp. AF48-14]